jgi:proteasome lid subunit RPN8/RPN11
MTVHRTNPLPTAESQGRLIVAEQVLSSTLAELRRPHDDGSAHERLVLWAGRMVGTTSIITTCITPRTNHGPQHVLLDESAVNDAARAARTSSLGIIAQVHSHPGSDTRHSDGDDRLVLMPFEGMFSLVVGDYGYGAIEPANGAGLHQFQHGRWVQVTNHDALVVVPAQLIGGNP